MATRGIQYVIVKHSFQETPLAADAPGPVFQSSDATRACQEESVSGKNEEMFFFISVDGLLWGSSWEAAWKETQQHGGRGKWVF